MTDLIDLCPVRVATRLRTLTALSFARPPVPSIVPNDAGPLIALSSTTALIPRFNSERAYFRGRNVMERRRVPRAAIHHLAQLRRRSPAAVVPRIGLALGGGFARGIAHAGVLRDLPAPRHSPSLHHRRERRIDRGGRLRQRLPGPRKLPTPPPPCGSETSRAGASAGWDSWRASG